MAVGSFRLPSGGASLIVDFSVDDATPDTNQTVTFTDLTVGATSWVWNFGDGTTSTLQNPTKSYIYAGTYTVTLAAENATTGGIETKVGFIVVTLQSIVSTNLQEHYRPLIGASPPNATIVSGAISSWVGSIGGYNLTQSAPTDRPAYSSSLITAPDGTVYGGITGDAINDYLINSAAGFTRGLNTTVYIVLRLNTAANNAALFSANAASTAVLSQAGNPDFTMNNGSSLGTATGYVLNQFFLLRVQFSNSGNSEFQINNLAVRSMGSRGGNTGTGFVLMTSSALFGRQPLSIVEIAVYSSNPTAGDVSNNLNYYKSRYGLW
jgi:PKD repeat protein